MSSHFSPPERVPTLTEVIPWPGIGAASPSGVTPTPAPLRAQTPASTSNALRHVDLTIPSPVVLTAPTASTTPTTSGATPPDELLTQQIYADLQRQVELMLEYRLRETLAPLLTRATDSIVRDARNELASTLRDVVARAVAQELSRHRSR